MQGYGNRGMAFEELLNIANQQYKQRGIALINKRPTPVKVLKSKGTQVLKGFYETKSTVDYDGIYNGQAIAFEAKSVQGKRFDLKNIHPHQLNYLENASKHGATTFFLIEFRDTHQVFFTPLSMIKFYQKQAEKGGRKSIPLDDFNVYAYEVQNGRGVILDYLAIVDKLEKAKTLSS